jgi:inner membrane protein
LYGFAVLALLSHLLLDFTNNYGVRPLFPFNGHWFAGSIVFIFDPLIFALLVSGLVLPSLFGLVSSEVGARRPVFRGRGLAIAALLGVVAIWSLRLVEHQKAMQMALGQTYANQTTDPATAEADEKPPVYLQAQRALASPDPLNPFHWSVVMDFGPVYQLAEVDTLNGTVTPDQTTYPKPSDDPSVRIAEGSPLGRAYMDWSSMPIVTVDRMSPGTGDQPEGVPAGGAVVEFRDPRFMGAIDWLHMGDRTPLSGMVTIDANGRVVRQSLDGRVER